MAQINNSQLSKEIIDGAKIQTSFNQIPTQLADKVVPVMEVNPKLLRRCNYVASATANGTIATTPTDRDLFIFAVTLCGQQNGAGTSNPRVVITPKGGLATTMVALQLRATAAVDKDSLVTSLNLTYPILLERGSTITFTTTATSATATVFGYTTEQG